MRFATVFMASGDATYSSIITSSIKLEFRLRTIIPVLIQDEQNKDAALKGRRYVGNTDGAKVQDDDTAEHLLADSSKRGSVAGCVVEGGGI